MKGRCGTYSQDHSWDEIIEHNHFSIFLPDGFRLKSTSEFEICSKKFRPQIDPEDMQLMRKMLDVY